MTTRRTPQPLPDLRVTVRATPEPGLLRPAIEAALAGRGFAVGPEHDVGRAVAEAVSEARAGARDRPRDQGGPSC
jgi:hypothetical protein